MNKIPNLVNSIVNHEGASLSVGTLRTLKLIIDESERMQHRIDLDSKELSRLNNKKVG